MILRHVPARKSAYLLLLSGLLFAPLARAQVRGGANVLVNLSNEGYWGTTSIHSGNAGGAGVARDSCGEPMCAAVRARSLRSFRTESPSRGRSPRRSGRWAGVLDCAQGALPPRFGPLGVVHWARKRARTTIHSARLEARGLSSGNNPDHS